MTNHFSYRGDDMEINRDIFKQLVESCECFYRAEDDLYDMRASGKYGRDFYKFFSFLDVTRALSVFANQREDGMDDDIQYEKFNALVTAPNYSIDEKTDILMGIVPNPFENIEIYVDPNKNVGLQRITAFKEILKNK